MQDFFYLTTYRKNYVKKPIKVFKQRPQPQQFQNPVSDAHKTYLDLKKTLLDPPEENAQIFYSKVKDQHKPLNKPLNVDLIHKEKITTEQRTEYQVKYCDFEETGRSSKESECVRLPEDLDVPLTTQRYCYRDPVVVNPAAYEPRLVIIPESEITNITKANKMVHGTTGVSEYMGRIGELGELIVETGKERHPKSCIDRENSQ